MAPAAHRGRRAGRDEGGVHQRGRLLRHPQASSTSIRQSSFSEPTSWPSACSIPGARVSASPRTRAITPAPRGLKVRWKPSIAICRQGTRHSRDRRGGEPHRDPHDRPALPFRSGPQSRHPRRVPGARLSDPQSVRSLPKDDEYLEAKYFDDELENGHHQEPARASTTSGPRTTRPTARRRCGRRSSRRGIPNVAVLDLSSFKCGHDAPTYGMIDSILQRRARRRGGAARSRCQQAGWLDQDPREDLRAHPQAAPRAARGRRQRKETLHHADIDKKRLELLEMKKAQLASKCAGDHRRSDRRGSRKGLRAYQTKIESKRVYPGRCSSAATEGRRHRSRLKTNRNNGE